MGNSEIFLKVNTFNNRFGGQMFHTGWNQALGSNWRCLE